MKKIAILLLALSTMVVAKPTVRSSSRSSSRSIRVSSSRRSIKTSSSKPKITSVKPKTQPTHKATPKSTSSMSKSTTSTTSTKTSTVSSAPKVKASASNLTSSSPDSSSPVIIRESSGNDFFTNYLMFKALSGNNDGKVKKQIISRGDEFIRILEDKLKRLKDEKNPENLEIIRKIEELIKVMKR